MNSLSKPILPIAAALLLATIGAGAPASATEATASMREASKPSHVVTVKRHARHVPRKAEHRVAWRYVRRVEPVPTRWEGCGAWCGRQMVLILGIGF